MSEEAHQWWKTKLKRGTLLPQHRTYQPRVDSKLLQDEFAHLAGSQGLPHRAVQTQMGRFLTKVCPPPGPGRTRRMENGRRVQILVFPKLAELRQFYGDPDQWREDKSARIQGKKLPSEPLTTSVTDLISQNFGGAK